MIILQLKSSMSRTRFIAQKCTTVCLCCCLLLCSSQLVRKFQRSHQIKSTQGCRSSSDLHYCTLCVTVLFEPHSFLIINPAESSDILHFSVYFVTACLSMVTWLLHMTLTLCCLHSEGLCVFTFHCFLFLIQGLKRNTSSKYQTCCTIDQVHFLMVMNQGNLMPRLVNTFIMWFQVRRLPDRGVSSPLFPLWPPHQLQHHNPPGRYLTIYCLFPPHRHTVCVHVHITATAVYQQNI